MLFHFLDIRVIVFLEMSKSGKTCQLDFLLPFFDFYKFYNEFHHEFYQVIFFTNSKDKFHFS